MLETAVIGGCRSSSKKEKKERVIERE